MKSVVTLAMPRCLVLRIVPCCLPQPKMHSVFARRDAAAGLLGFGLEHYLRSAALGSPGGERDPAGHRQPMPVLHGSVAHIAELRLPPGGLAVKTAVGIAGARMRV